MVKEVQPRDLKKDRKLKQEVQRVWGAWTHTGWICKYTWKERKVTCKHLSDEESKGSQEDDEEHKSNYVAFNTIKIEEKETRTLKGDASCVATPVKTSSINHDTSCVGTCVITSYLETDSELESEDEELRDEDI